MAHTRIEPASEAGAPLAEDPSALVDSVEPLAERPSTRFRVSAFGRWAVPLLLGVLVIGFSVAAPETFASVANLRVLIGGQATIVLLALAVLVPMRAGDFDLSISAVMILTGVTVGVLTAHGLPVTVACAAAAMIGPAVGVLNGLLVVRLGIDSLIATLGTMTILGGLAGLVSGNALITSIPSELTRLSSFRFLGFGTPVWIGWIVALALWYLFELTPWGRYLLFIGGNRNAAQLAGLRVRALRRGAFVFSGSLSSLVGLLYAGLLGAVSPSVGTAYLLQPITAAFLGASAIKLGRFNVFGTLVAIYLLAVGITGLQHLGLRDWVADVFNGACLIGAVGFTMVFRRGSPT